MSQTLPLVLIRNLNLDTATVKDDDTIVVVTANGTTARKRWRDLKENFITTATAPPGSSTADGEEGQVAWDEAGVYTCYNGVWGKSPRVLDYWSDFSSSSRFLRVDSSQSLTAAEQAQGRENLHIVSATTSEAGLTRLAASLDDNTGGVPTAAMVKEALDTIDGINTEGGDRIAGYIGPVSLRTMNGVRALVHHTADNIIDVGYGADVVRLKARAYEFRDEDGNLITTIERGWGEAHDITVEQTFSPESENPQSGTALWPIFSDLSGRVDSLDEQVASLAENIAAGSEWWEYEGDGSDTLYVRRDSTKPVRMVAVPTFRVGVAPEESGVWLDISYVSADIIARVWNGEMLVTADGSSGLHVGTQSTTLSCGTGPASFIDVSSEHIHLDSSGHVRVCADLSVSLSARDPKAIGREVNVRLGDGSFSVAIGGTRVLSVDSDGIHGQLATTQALSDSQSAFIPPQLLVWTDDDKPSPDWNSYLDIRINTQDVTTSTTWEELITPGSNDTGMTPPMPTNQDEHPLSWTLTFFGSQDATAQPVTVLTPAETDTRALPEVVVNPREMTLVRVVSHNGIVYGKVL